MHIADEKVSLAMKQSSADDAASSNSSKSQATQPPTTQQSKDTSGSMIQIQAMTTVPHERNKFIEELCQMFFDLFTDYWRLGSMYLQGNLTINPTDLTLNLKSSQQLTLLVKEITRKKTPDEFYSLVGTILNTFSDIVRAAFIPHTFETTTTTTTANAGDAANDENNTNIGGSNKNLFLPWPIQHDAKIISQILPHCLRSCR